MAGNTASLPSIHQTIVGSLPYSILLLNRNGAILFCNAIFQVLFGLPMMAVYLKKIDDIIPGADLNQMVTEVQADGMEREIELLYEKEPGNKKILKVLIRKITVTGEGMTDVVMMTLEDISEKTRLEVDAIHLEKLESMMTIAKGIAHDLGNMVYSISSSLLFIKEKKMENMDPDIASEVDFLIGNVDQMANWLTTLLEFSNSETFQSTKEDIRTVINRSIALLEKEARRRDVVIDSSLSEEIPPFWMDKKQMEQVVLNLLKNAIESMPEGGRILIHASFDPAKTEENDGFVLIEICDTGVGISEENSGHIFRQLFSTKKGGHGLGLFRCEQIVEKHKGTITVRSEPGHGSIFTVKLPVPFSLPEQAEVH